MFLVCRISIIKKTILFICTVVIFTVIAQFIQTKSNTKLLVPVPVGVVSVRFKNVVTDLSVERGYHGAENQPFQATINALNASSKASPMNQRYNILRENSESIAASYERHSVTRSTSELKNRSLSSKPNRLEVPSILKEIIITEHESRIMNESLQNQITNITYSRGRSISSRFVFGSDLTLPWHCSKDITTIQNQTWVQNLISFLISSVPGEPIILVSADNNYKEALLNWFISLYVLQDTPPRNVLLLTYTKELCRFIEDEKKIASCLFISTNTIMEENIFNHGKRFHELKQLLIIRMSVIRLANYWGFDVANFDTDALLLKNPLPLFKQHEDSDIVGTFGGSLPEWLSKKWGVVMCMGAVLFRSTPLTEQLWQLVHKNKYLDDQIKMNEGLNDLHIKWRQQIFNLNSSRLNDSSLNILWIADARAGLKVTLLPQVQACRGFGCRRENKDQCYIWHHGKNKHNFERMSNKIKEDGMWYLREDWEDTDALTGHIWLKEISLYSTH